MEPGHERAQASRGQLLIKAIARLDDEWSAKHDGGDERLRTISMLQEVVQMQLQAAGQTGSPGSLDFFVPESHSDVLCRLAQALSHAIELLQKHERHEYEFHVALRTVRTIGEIECVQPSRKVAWRMSEAYGNGEHGEPTGSSTRSGSR